MANISNSLNEIINNKKMETIQQIQYISPLNEILTIMLLLSFAVKFFSFSVKK